MTADPGLDIAPDQMNHVLADGNLRRCFCGVPIWFDRGRDPLPGQYPDPPCWRTTNGGQHMCEVWPPAPPPGEAP